MKTVIEMAREAGWDDHHAEFDTRIERFAELVRAAALTNIYPSSWMSFQEGLEAGRLAEREACATVPENFMDALRFDAAMQEPWPEAPAGHKAGGVQPSGTSKSKAITELYALFGAPHNADINLTRLNILLDELIASPPAQLAPAPGYCKHCKQYTIEEPLPAQQEPVALETVYEIIIHWDEGGGKRSRRELARRIFDLYATPPQRTWVGLTDEERYELLDKAYNPESYAVLVEAKLKEKNT